MADFCRPCTAETFGAEYADRNDFRHEGSEPISALCEGCGWGLFDRAGDPYRRTEERP